MGLLHQVRTTIELQGTTLAVTIQTDSSGYDDDNDIYISTRDDRQETSMDAIEVFAKRLLAAVALHREK